MPKRRIMNSTCSSAANRACELRKPTVRLLCRESGECSRCGFGEEGLFPAEQPGFLIKTDDLSCFGVILE